MQNGLCHGRGEPSALPHSTQHSTTKSSNSCSGWPVCTASTQGLCFPPAIIICRQHASRAAHAHVHCGSRPLHSLCCHACSDAACRALHHSATLSLGMACSYDWGYVCVLLFTVIHLPACAAAARSIRLLLLLQCYWVLWQPNQCTESPRVMPYVHDKMVMHHHVHVTHHFVLSRSALVGAS